MTSAESSEPNSFRVELSNFSGPFDLLLALIHRRQLDVTEVALSQVTDDFISYLAAAGDGFDLSQATEFLVVAATLLDLKVARLLPATEVQDEEDLALLESRDLLFARVLQYRAYKLAAQHLAELDRTAARRFGRDVELEERFAALSPIVQIGAEPSQLAAIAALALTPRPVPVVGIDHLHAPRVSVTEQMHVLRRLLSGAGVASFRTLIADCTSTLEVVARFLGLLELYREGVVGFEQAVALGELRVQWAGADTVGDPADQSGGDAVVSGTDIGGTETGGTDSGIDTDADQVDEEYG